MASGDGNKAREFLLHIDAVNARESTGKIQVLEKLKKMLMEIAFE